MVVVDIKGYWKRDMLTVSTEWFSRDGTFAHYEHQRHGDDATVCEVAEELTQTWQPQWKAENLAYGVIKRDVGRNDMNDWDRLPAHAPTRLRWVAQHPSWRTGMTMRELFADVQIKADERWLLVDTELDLRWSDAETEAERTARRARVETAVHWLSGLYLVDGQLRATRTLHNPAPAAHVVCGYLRQLKGLQWGEVV
jgi:hypothetical protein